MPVAKKDDHGKDDHGKDDHGKDNEGLFEVFFGATDTCDLSPAVNAVLVVEGIAKPISVSTGQRIKFDAKGKHGDAKIQWKKGRLEVKAAAMMLEVTGTDACGNTATAVARPNGHNTRHDDDRGLGRGHDNKSHFVK